MKNIKIKNNLINGQHRKLSDIYIEVFDKDGNGFERFNIVDLYINDIVNQKDMIKLSKIDKKTSGNKIAELYIKTLCKGHDVAKLVVE